MINLKQFDNRRPRLHEYLYWAFMVRPGVILNKDGSVMKCFAFRGHDIESSTQEEILGTTIQINNAVKRFGDGWSLWVDSIRLPATAYLSCDATESPTLARLNELERTKQFSSGRYYDNRYVLAVSWYPPPDIMAKATRFFIDTGTDTDAGRATGIDELINDFERNITRIANIINPVMYEWEELTEGRLLRYLNFCATFEDGEVNPPRVPVQTPAGVAWVPAPVFLDAVIGAKPVIGGFIPKIGDYYVRAISPIMYPTDSLPMMLHALNTIGIPYRYTLRFMPLDKATALHELDAYSKKWFMSRKSMLTYIIEAFKGGVPDESRVNRDAVAKSEDALVAMQEVAQDSVALGYHTLSVFVWDKDLMEADKKAEIIEKTFNSRGFRTYRETINTLRAWFGSHPGNTRANVRRPLMTSLNFVHVMPASAVWAGDEINRHLGQPCLISGVAAGSTPFRFNLHVGDVGHTLIIGPTGAGKSVLLNFLELSWLKYPNAKVYVFDKGKSSYVLARALGAIFYDLKADGSVSFQPLAGIDNEAERAWAQEWILDVVSMENITITPEIKSAVWSALTNLASAKRERRTLSTFLSIIQDKVLREALASYTVDGPYGRLFDTSVETVGQDRMMYFEMEELMNSSRQLIQATIMYIFHKLEQLFTGEPTLLVLDESWVFLSSDIFAGKLREWLKVLRKKNASVVFATQSLADVTESAIASAVADSVATRIFLPNPKAMDPNISEIYRKFGLNQREIMNLARAQQKRDYYASSVLGTRMFQLDLSKAVLAFVAGASPETNALCDRIYQSVGGNPDAFIEAWCAAKGVKFDIKKRKPRPVQEPLEDSGDVPFRVDPSLERVYDSAADYQL